MLIGLAAAEDSRGQETDVFWTVNRVQKFPSVDSNITEPTAKLTSITFTEIFFPPGEAT